jgi:formate hydrogenlyase subunit 4
MTTVLYAFVNLILVVLLAPLFEGISRKLTARIQSRKGPPVVQPYYDLLKLLGKEDIEVGESPVLQRLAAYLSAAAILTVALLVPMGGPRPWAAREMSYFSSISSLSAEFPRSSPRSRLGRSTQWWG